jgi:glycosyltransferase involved in cell wall biosynthesis
MEKKIKVLTISDMPLSPSGVGTQTKYMCEALLKSGKFTVRSLGGAVKHPKYDPVKTEEWGDDWIMYPVDGYGNPEMIRSILRQEKPDILWFMTDPRFWGWLWEMENEIRPLCPMVYYHVWDNYPYPTYNRKFYESNDFIATISKVTDDIVKTVAPNVKSQYIPHAVDSEIFTPVEEDEALEKLKQEVFGEHYDPDKFIFFWNNRNARRKQSGSLIFWFNDFLEKVGKDKACLVMHTEVKDQHGQDLQAIIESLGLTNGEVLFSQTKVPPDKLALIYNMADCTVNISDAEGFGLATLESLSCGTPIIVSMTGGLQEQVVSTDGKEHFGIGLVPASKAVIGSQEIPWIYEDRLSGGDVVDAMETMFYMSKEERTKLGLAGRKHVMENYNFETFNTTWVETLVGLHEEEGSWETRKETQRWILEEMAV